MSALAVALGTTMAVVIVAQATVLMRPSAKALGSPGIVRLQLAGSAAAVNKLKGIWLAPRIAAAAENTRWDFFLIFGYTIGLALLGVLLHQPAAAALGLNPLVLVNIVVAVPVVAGLCDVIENILTFLMLARDPTNSAAMATKILASIKWLGLLLAVVWSLLVALPIAIVRWAV